MDYRFVIIAINSKNMRLKSTFIGKSKKKLDKVKEI